MENNISVSAVNKYKELEAKLMKIFEEAEIPTVTAESDSESLQNNNLFMKGYMTGFNELYEYSKELRFLLDRAVDTIKTADCGNACIVCAKNVSGEGIRLCDGNFKWLYQDRADKVLHIVD